MKRIGSAFTCEKSGTSTHGSTVLDTYKAGSPVLLKEFEQTVTAFSKARLELRGIPLRSIA